MCDDVDQHHHLVPTFCDQYQIGTAWLCGPISDPHVPSLVKTRALTRSMKVCWGRSGKSWWPVPADARKGPATGGLLREALPSSGRLLPSRLGLLQHHVQGVHLYKDHQACNAAPPYGLECGSGSAFFFPKALVVHATRSVMSVVLVLHRHGCRLGLLALPIAFALVLVAIPVAGPLAGRFGVVLEWRQCLPRVTTSYN